MALPDDEFRDHHVHRLCDVIAAHSAELDRRERLGRIARAYAPRWG